MATVLPLGFGRPPVRVSGCDAGAKVAGASAVASVKDGDRALNRRVC